MKRFLAVILFSTILISGCGGTDITAQSLFTECGSVAVVDVSGVSASEHIGGRENVQAITAIIDVLTAENIELRSAVRCYEAQVERGSQ